MSLKKFIQKKCSGLGIITTLATYVGLLVGLDYLYTKYWDGPMVSAVVWSASVAFAIYAFVGLLIYCWFTHLLLVYSFIVVLRKWACKKRSFV